MNRASHDQQPADERSGRYACDQWAETEVGLPEITNERLQSVLTWGVLILSIIVACLLPAIVIMDWLRR
jgi:hypothetical protein